jgi:hypothetical protein
VLKPKTFCYRQFIVANYPVIKQHNPDLPVLIREARDTPARVFARFGVSYFPLVSSSFTHQSYGTSERGVERHVEIDNLSLSDIDAKVAQLLKSAT